MILKLDTEKDFRKSLKRMEKRRDELCIMYKMYYNDSTHSAVLTEFHLLNELIADMDMHCNNYSLLD